VTSVTADGAQRLFDRAAAENRGGDRVNRSAEGAFLFDLELGSAPHRRIPHDRDDVLVAAAADRRQRDVHRQLEVIGAQQHDVETVRHRPGRPSVGDVSGTLRDVLGPEPARDQRLDRRIDELRTRIPRERAELPVHGNDLPRWRRDHDTVWKRVDQLIEGRVLCAAVLIQHHAPCSRGTGVLTADRLPPRRRVQRSSHVRTSVPAYDNGHP
jgi:hypothetical protein